MKNKKIITIVCLVIFIVIFTVVFNQNKKTPQTTTKIEDCWNTGFGWSKMYTPTEKQKDCADITLTNAEPIKITKTSVGDISLSDVKNFANNNLDISIKLNKDFISPPLKTTLGDCISSNDSNAGQYGCLLDTEEALQRTIRSLVLAITEQDIKNAPKIDDTDPTLYIQTRKEYWQNWYYESIKSGSIKETECNIESTNDAFGGSGNTEMMGGCYIRKDAQEILWLLEQLDEVNISYSTVRYTP